MGRIRKRVPEHGAPAPEPMDADLLLTLGQLLLPIVFAGVLIFADDYEFAGSGSGLWFLAKLLAPAALVAALLVLLALTDRRAKPFATRLIGRIRLWLLLFALLTGPLSLFIGSGHLVNLYNARYGQASQSVAVIASYESVSGPKNSCTEHFGFRIEPGALSEAVVRAQRPGDCRSGGYSGRSVDLQLRRSWIGVSIASMKLHPAQGH